MTLRETLLGQLNDLSLSIQDTQISKVIIDCIDEQGMLTESIAKIEEILNFIFTESEIENVLKTRKTRNVHKKYEKCINYLGDLYTGESSSIEVNDDKEVNSSIDSLKKSPKGKYIDRYNY